MFAIFTNFVDSFLIIFFKLIDFAFIFSKFIRKSCISFFLNWLNLFQKILLSLLKFFPCQSHLSIYFSLILLYQFLMFNDQCLLLLFEFFLLNLNILFQISYLMSKRGNILNIILLINLILFSSLLKLWWFNCQFFTLFF